MKNNIYRLRILKAKEGELNNLKYALNIDSNKRNEGLLFRKIYQSVGSYTKNRAKNILIELSEWESEKHLSKYKEYEKVNKYESYHVKLDIKMIPEDGWGYSLSSLIKEGQALEFGVREIKENKKNLFFRRREEFLNIIKENEGVEFDFEMKSIDGKYNIMIFGWKSYGMFKKASKTSFTSLKAIIGMVRYFPLMKQKDFQVGI